MGIQDFIVDLLCLSAHHGPAGLALQKYAAGLMRSEVQDLELLDEGEEARFYSTIHYDETVTERGNYGEHFKFDQLWLSHAQYWRARATHLQTWLTMPAKTHRHAMLALIDMARRHDLDTADTYLRHLWGSGWFFEVDHAAQLIWNVKRAMVAELPFDVIEAELDFVFSQSILNNQSLAQTAAIWTRQRGIYSPMMERVAGAEFGLADMRLIRSRDNLGRMNLYLDLVHNESIIYHTVRYILQEAYLLEEPYLRTIEKFIEDNLQRCDDCEQVLRLGPRAPRFVILLEAIAGRRWDDATEILEQNKDFRICYPGYLDEVARDMIQQHDDNAGALEARFLRSLSKGQRLAIEFGWQTQGIEDPDEAARILHAMPRPY